MTRLILNKPTRQVTTPINRNKSLFDYAIDERLHELNIAEGGDRIVAVVGKHAKNQGSKSHA